MSACRFGYEEDDGYRYCHEHAGFWHYTNRTTSQCDRAHDADDEHPTPPNYTTQDGWVVDRDH